MIRIAFAFAVLAVAAVSAPSQTLSYLDFGKGPAQWIMTQDEQRAWRNIRTEEQAHEFADLFWARRDPTPGTPRNEFRSEFDSRVAYAEAHFKETGRRGALTERGRVLVVLGFPTNFSEGAASTSRQWKTNVDMGTDVMDPTGGRQMAAKDTWEYSHATAEKFGLPKIEVVFVHDGFQDRVRRDPQRTDFTSALPAAIKSYIVSSEMTQVPEWAATRQQFSAAAGPAEHLETHTEDVVTTKRTVVDRPAPVAKAAGAGKLTLMTDISALQPQSGIDPFASLHSSVSFKRDQELGWTAEFCAGAISPEAPALKVQLRISGGPATQPVNMASAAEEFVPDSIKASPGCYLVRGSLPLADVEPGSYNLTVAIAGPREEQRYNLTREFRVE